VARLPSPVATRRAHFKHLLVADLHGAGFRASELAHVPDAGAGDRDDPCITRFAVVRRDRRGALEGLVIRICAEWALEDDVAAWPPARMALPIVWPGHPEAQRIVVGIRPTNQDLPPTWQCVRDQMDLLGVSLWRCRWHAGIAFRRSRRGRALVAVCHSRSAPRGVPYAVAHGGACAVVGRMPGQPRVSIRIASHRATDRPPTGRCRPQAVRAREGCAITLQGDHH